MKIGLYGVGLGAMADPTACQMAQLAEDLGYESLWTGEHMLVPSPQAPPSHRSPRHPFFDPIVALTFLAARTSTIRLATGVLVLPQRHPVQLAKELASLDVLSGGRLIVGVGIGYVEPELRSFGVDMASRARRTDQHLAAMRELWCADAPTFSGEFVSFNNVDAYPRPVSCEGPPIVIGGSSSGALRRAILWGQGWYGYRIGPQRTTEIIAQLRQEADLAQRTMPEITVTPDCLLTDEVLAAYADAGVQRLVITAEGERLSDVEQIVRANAPARWT